MRRTGTPMRSGGRETRRERRIAAARRQSMIPGSPLAAPYRPLGDADVTRVHRAALDLLERVGMAAPTGRIRDAALAHGYSLSDTGRLLYPRGLVEDTLARAAGSFTVHGRDPRFDFEARNGTVNFCTGGAAVKMLDLETRDYRPSTLRSDDTLSVDVIAEVVNGPGHGCRSQIDIKRSS